MTRALSRVAVLLFAAMMAFGQESRSPQTTERVPPCTLHPVNGRICVSEGVLRGFLMRFVAPKMPAGANENGEVVLHVIVPRTGGKPVKISVVSGDPALTRLAVRAVRDWVFMAYRYENKYVEMESDVHVRFKTPE